MMMQQAPPAAVQGVSSPVWQHWGDPASKAPVILLTAKVFLQSLEQIPSPSSVARMTITVATPHSFKVR